MKIACCQFDPKWGQVKENMNTVDSLLEGYMHEYTKEDIDVLVLPEMAFSGYVFTCVEEIEPFLEDSETGPTVTWAKRTAIRLHSYVIVGYPQKKDQTNYNSICFVNPAGELITTYQKAFLYETDENWAEEGPGFVSIRVEGLGKVGLGICMDLNPYKFEADFDDCEFANYHLQQNTDIILCSMAWLTSIGSDRDSMHTILYWAKRLLPLYTDIEEGKHTLFVACNRVGSERGSVFAGSSCVFDIFDEKIVILDSMKNNTGVMIVELQ